MVKVCWPGMICSSSHGGLDFSPAIPGTPTHVKKGDPILLARRDAGPDEIAAAENKRESLRQELEFVKSDALSVDPLVLREYTLAEGSLRDLEERSQNAVDARDAIVRDGPQRRLENQSRHQTIEDDLRAMEGELEQIRVSLESAVRLYESAERAVDSGIIARDEFEHRRERVNVLRSRQQELQGRSEQLRRQRAQTTDLTSRTEGTYSRQLAVRSAEIASLDKRISMAREMLGQVAQKIEADKLRAAAQREKRLKQIQIQIDDLNTLLDTTETTLSARAPWDGIVGFREPSPASVRSEARPLLVLFRPGTLNARVQLPAVHAGVYPGEKLSIRVRALTTEAAGTAVAAELVDRLSLPDGMVELLFATHPPPAAVRDLAMGNTVPVSVIVRRPDLLARLGLRWPAALAFIGVFAFVTTEVRRRFERRRRLGEGPSSASDRVPPAFPSRAFRLDWGDGATEFQEFVVGVGMVSRRIRPHPQASVVAEVSSPVAAAPESHAPAPGSLHSLRDLPT